MLLDKATASGKENILWGALMAQRLKNSKEAAASIRFTPYTVAPRFGL